MDSGFLSGYKTYIVAGMGMLGAVAGFATGEMSGMEAMRAAFEAAGFMTLRSGVGSLGKVLRK